MCLACYNFAVHYRRCVDHCLACHRRVPLRDGYCRLCWCQARLDRAATAENSRDRTVLAPYAAKVRYHQLFLADLHQPHAPPPTTPRRRGAKGRRPKQAPPAASRPSPDSAQLLLLTDLPRTYRRGSVDLRSTAAPDNPWLAWALHLAWTTAETHGFAPEVRRALDRNLIMLLTTHTDGDLVRVSQFHRLICHQGGSALVHVIDILSAMGILLDDRPTAFDTWLDAKLDGLAPAIAHQAERWVRTLHDGGPRQHRRTPANAMAYFNGVRPALQTWSASHDHLREITRDEVLAYLADLHGEPRILALGGLRSLFAWAKRNGVVFQNPCTRIRHTPRVRRIWQPLSDDEMTAALRAADTPQARLCVVLAAVYAARPGQIRALLLDDVDLGNRRITVGGRSLPIDEITATVLREWLDHRRSRWPRTANPHLLISKETALRTGPVSTAFLPNLRGLAATLERLRIDRELEEAITCGADPLHLSVMFGISGTNAIRWATNARQLLTDPHTANPPGSTPTRAPTHPDAAGEHSGSP
ncbi:tyrosine recombinase XerC [Nocardia sp. NPDC059246]|uniref:site-specific integrase n=1 Tax=unclassified Nocardia TaxID=2637762 RepID=UPI0036878821